MLSRCATAGDGTVRASDRVRPPPARRAGARLGAYVALTKPRIIELLLVTTVPAMMLAARGWPSWRLLLSTLVGGTLAAGAANVFNCYYDRDIDKLMHRTQRRPLPSGTVTPRAALMFGIVLTVASVVLLAVTTTLLAAALAAGAIFYYAVIYTIVLKRHTRRSTVFGGVPGAAPVLIGWAAVTGSLAWPPSCSSASSSAGRCRTSGRWRCGSAPTTRGPAVPMLPVVAPALSVGRQTVVWAWLTVAVSLLLWPVARGTASAGCTPPSRRGAGRWFVLEAHRLLGRIRRGAETRPMKLFHISISYMALLSVAIIVDVLV